MRLAQKNTKSRLGEFLLQRNLINEDEQLQLLSYQLGIEYREDLLISSSTILSTNLPRPFIKKYNVVILNEDDINIEIAINDPFQFEVIENIKIFIKKNVKLVLAKKLDILKLSDALTGEEGESADKVVEGLKDEGDIQILGEVSDTGEDVLDLANEAPIIKLVNLIDANISCFRNWTPHQFSRFA